MIPTLDAVPLTVLERAERGVDERASVQLAPIKVDLRPLFGIYKRACVMEERMPMFNLELKCRR